MKLIDRYILAELWGPFCFGIAAFTSILAGSAVLFQLVAETVRMGIPIGSAALIFVCRLPAVVVYTFPMSMLLAVIVGFGRLSSDSEIIAFRAAGVGIFRMMVPVCILGIGVSLVTLMFNEFIVPRATFRGQTLIQSFVRNQQPRLKNAINNTEYDSHGRPIRMINAVSITGSELHDITIAEFDDGILNRITRAERGHFNPEGVWVFHNGVIHEFSQLKDKSVWVATFGTQSFRLPLTAADIRQRHKSANEMNARELIHLIQKKARMGEDATANRVELSLKFAIPFASLIFALLGSSVGLRPQRSTASMGLGISLVIIVAYYTLLSVGMGLGFAHVVPPLIAAWLPNAIAGGAAVAVLFQMANR